MYLFFYFFVLYTKQVMEIILKQVLLVCKQQLRMYSLFWGDYTPPNKKIYPFTTSLVFALYDSVNGISTTTASTGVPGFSEYFSGK